MRGPALAHSFSRKSMEDQSELDRKYFIDEDTYNCPFCNRHSVVYSIVDSFSFDWSKTKTTHGYIVRCHGCNNDSIHLSFFPLSESKFHFSFEMRDTERNLKRYTPDKANLDDLFFLPSTYKFFYPRFKNSRGSKRISS